MKHALAIVFLFTCLPAFSQYEADNTILSQYIVMLKPGHSVKGLISKHTALRQPVCLSQRMNIWLIDRGTSAGAEIFLDTLQNDPDVKLAQFNHRIQRRAIVPNDTFFSMQWSLHNVGQDGGTSGDDIDAEDAWTISHNNLTTAGDTIVVAIVDVSFDYTHQDLNFFVNHQEIPDNGIDDDNNGYVDDYYGWNAINNNGNINEGGTDDHSMHCSGIAGAIGNNKTGITGVCWGPQIMRISGASEVESQVVGAYAYIIQMRALYDSSSGAKGAFVVSTNSSFGVGNYGANPADYPIWCAMYDSMGAYGILSAAAAPDWPVNVDQANDVPTGCPSKYLITVTNTTANDRLYNGAAWGKITIDIGAPGTSIYSTYSSNGYGYMTGTSMSSPHIAGAVAEMFSAACPQLLADYKLYPDSISLLFKQMMLAGASRLSDLYNKTTSGGRLNLYHSVLNLGEYNCNHCADTVTLTYTQPTCYDSCNGSAQVNVSGTGGYNFGWSNGTGGYNSLQNLCAGFYSVTVTDSSGCQQVRNFTLYNPDSIDIISINLRPVVTGDSGNIIVTASAGNYVLEYGLDSLNYQSGSTLIIENNGNYNVYVRSETGCVAERNVTVTATQNNNLSLAGNISVSPNPANDVLNISLNLPQATELRFTIFNALGEAVIDESKQVPSGIHIADADVSSLANGVYFLRVASGGAGYIHKFIVVKN
jgi:Subtilase family/Secretion system C-terminal sorting domain